jgi:hypothetical protein
LAYDQQILQVLVEAGERGISIKNISRHVYNMNCTFFAQPDFEEIRTYVGHYLLRNSKSAQALVESTGRRGYYRLNTSGSSYARQMLLDLSEKKDEEEEEQRPVVKDLSLDLFD